MCLQGNDKSHLSLKDYLNGYGISDLGFLGLLWICAFLASKMEECGGILMGLVLACYQLFKIAWFIIGIVILARTHGSCLVDGQDIGIMTLISIIVTEFPVCAVGVVMISMMND